MSYGASDVDCFIAPRLTSAQALHVHLGSGAVIRGRVKDVKFQALSGPNRP